jgi:hypothetical protein
MGLHEFAETLASKLAPKEGRGQILRSKNTFMQ